MGAQRRQQAGLQGGSEHVTSVLQFSLHLPTEITVNFMHERISWLKEELNMNWLGIWNRRVAQLEITNLNFKFNKYLYSQKSSK